MDPSQNPNLTTAVTVGLATRWATWVWSESKIAHPIRTRTLDALGRHNTPSSRWARELLSCDACTGWWVSVALTRSMGLNTMAGNTVHLALLIAEQRLAPPLPRRAPTPPPGD